MGRGKGAQVWVARDYLKCSGCRICEVVCSIHHEGRIWPEASRIRVFMLIPGIEVPHFCTQCPDYPCVKSCPFNALSVNEETGAVLVDKKACVGCGKCFEACPGRIPHLHPKENYVLICDLCDGNPQCAKVCQEGKWNALSVSKKGASLSYKLYARTPEEMTKELVLNLYGEGWEDWV